MKSQAGSTAMALTCNFFIGLRWQGKKNQPGSLSPKRISLHFAKTLDLELTPGSTIY